MSDSIDFTNQWTELAGPPVSRTTEEPESAGVASYEDLSEHR
jgi:hypothetical protein